MEWWTTKPPESASKLYPEGRFDEYAARWLEIADGCNLLLTGGGGGHIVNYLSFVDGKANDFSFGQDENEKEIEKMSQDKNDDEVIAHIGTGYAYNLAVHGSISSSSLAISSEKIWGNLKILQRKAYSTESFEADVANVSAIAVREISDPVKKAWAVVQVVLAAFILTVLAGLILVEASGSDDGCQILFFIFVIITLVGYLIAARAKSQALAINVQGKEYVALVNGVSDEEIDDFIKRTRETARAAVERAMKRQTAPVVVEQTTSLKQKLEELEDLRKNGLIGEDEFVRMRQTVIERL